MATETLMTLAQAARSLPVMRGKAVAPSTLYRWARHGLDGIRLETIVLGRTTYTTDNALQTFAEQLTAARNGMPVGPVESDGTTRRLHAADAARVELATRFGVRTSTREAKLARRKVQ